MLIFIGACVCYNFPASLKNAMILCNNKSEGEKYALWELGESTNFWLKQRVCGVDDADCRS